MQAINMVAQILQRHVSAMQTAPTVLAIDSAPDAESERAVEQSEQVLPDNDTMRQEIMRALFADSDPVEREAPPAPPSVATPLPALPSSLVRCAACFSQLRRIR